VYAQRNQEHKEEAVVAATNTVVHPWAVVVKCLQKHQRYQQAPSYKFIIIVPLR
jgi:hypothetical protein